MSPIGLASLAIAAPRQAATPAPSPAAGSPAGSSPAGSGPAGSGPVGSGPVGSGLAGSGLAGSGPANVEPAQPVYGRYWLHGKGPAPAGNLPVAVHVNPVRLALPPGGAATLRVTVACGPEPAAGQVDLDVPAGLMVHPAGPLRYELPGGGHAAWDVAVRAEASTGTGRYFVAARIRDGLGQLIEDAALVAVGEPASPDTTLPLEELLPLVEADLLAGEAEIGIDVLTPEISCAPGGQAELAVRIRNQLASELRGEAQLVSPFGTWDALTPWTSGFAAAPGEGATVRYQVAIPATARPGAQWWAVVKVMYFGRARYTPAIPITVTKAPAAAGLTG
jgi:hypothetical protein